MGKLKRGTPTGGMPQGLVCHSGADRPSISANGGYSRLGTRISSCGGSERSRYG